MFAAGSREHVICAFFLTSHGQHHRPNVGRYSRLQISSPFYQPRRSAASAAFFITHQYNEDMCLCMGRPCVVLDESASHRKVLSLKSRFVIRLFGMPISLAGRVSSDGAHKDDGSPCCKVAEARSKDEWFYHLLICYCY